MAEEKKQPVPKQVKTVFVGDENLPTHYVNSVNIRAGLEEFFLTFGTALPLDIVDIKDLENIDSVNAHALFRCAITRSMMKQLIDLMTSLYDNQLEQVEQLQTSQRRDEAYGNSDSKPS
ncbi:MAG TPA: hypothetical protein VK140_14110 [Ktedonobacteraceae bacterium]|nr:hypothetical protein [Ktedonobacteraceae bacterium]